MTAITMSTKIYQLPPASCAEHKRTKKRKEKREPYAPELGRLQIMLIVEVTALSKNVTKTYVRYVIWPL